MYDVYGLVWSGLVLISKSVVLCYCVGIYYNRFDLLHPAPSLPGNKPAVSRLENSSGDDQCQHGKVNRIVCNRTGEFSDGIGGCFWFVFGHTMSKLQPFGCEDNTKHRITLIACGDVSWTETNRVGCSISSLIHQTMHVLNTKTCHKLVQFWKLYRFQNFWNCLSFPK